jgi:thiol-disulfide isomerase/thioredoxin
MMRTAVLLALTALLAGCFGRIQDKHGQKIDPAKYGLDGEHPALIVFGAGWCKPCLAEIPSLNKAQVEFKDQLQIRNFLVEGPQKGVASTESDISLIQSPKGDRPEYSVTLDPTWALFDLLEPASGRALPTMVFVTWDQTIDRIVQRSMEFDAELMPALRALIAGQPTQKPDDGNRPGQGGEEQKGELKAMTFTEWSTSKDNEPGSAIYAAFEDSWRKGLDEYAFLEDDMPFNKAKMTVLVYSDGKVVPRMGVWTAMLTGCKLTVYVKPDGSFEKSEGICK